MKYLSDKKVMDNGVGECVSKSVMMPMSLLLFNMLATCSSGDATGKDTISLASSLRPRPGLQSM